MSANIGGRYEGTGVWHDSTGASMTYQVLQTNSVTPVGFEISFTHKFPDGNVAEARVVLNEVAPYIYSVRAGGNEIGHGYAMGDVVRYHMRAGAGIVEVGYQPRGGDKLEVFGSSTTNAAGNYIAWREELRRVGDA